MVRSIINQNLNTFQNPEYGIPSINNQMADVSRNQLNQLNRLGAGSGMSLNEIKEMSPPGAFDSVTPQEFQQIQDGTFNKDNLVSSIGSGLENFFFPSAAAAESEIRPDNNLNSFNLNAPEFSITDMLQQDVNKDIYNGYRPEQPASANSMGPEFYGSAPNKNFLTGILESLSDLELQDYLPFGEKSISGMAVRGAGNMVRGIGNFFQGNPRQRARNEANKRFGVGDIYGYGMGAGNLSNKDAFGFNTVSGFGDYEQHMRDQLDKLNAQKAAGKTFRPGSWQDKMVKDYGESISTIDAEAAAADKAEKDKFNRMLSNMSGGGGDAGYSPGQSAGMGFGGGRTDPTDKS